MGATMTRVRHLAVLTLIAMCMAPPAPQTGAQTVFRAGVDVVRLDVLATQGGRPITGLGEQDFEVIDNGIPQRVKMATTAGDVTVVLLLDTSGSVAGDPLDHFVAASQAVVTLLKPGDRASLVTFSHQLSLQAASVRDPDAVRSALESARAAGRTALWDALFGGISLVAGRPERSLILVFTDGVDNSSWMTRRQVAESLLRAETVVYAVQSRMADRATTAGRDRETKAWGALQEVVKPSGGVVLEAESTAQLPAQFAAIFQEFRSRYLVTYEPAGVRRDDGWHRVEVRVKGRRAKVVTRTGYYATGGRSNQSTGVAEYSNFKRLETSGDVLSCRRRAHSAPGRPA
jgi:VWFA-related protein